MPSRSPSTSRAGLLVAWRSSATCATAPRWLNIGFTTISLPNDEDRGPLVLAWYFHRREEACGSPISPSPRPARAARGLIVRQPDWARAAHLRFRFFVISSPAFVEDLPRCWRRPP